jgi:hypothetical protein
MRVRAIGIIPLPDQGQLRWTLHLHGNNKTISFEMTYDDGMRIRQALSDLQVKHKIPIPSDLRPSGKPTLVLLKKDDSES